MMRLLLAFLGLALLTAAAPVRDWSAATRETPAGVFVTGNPAAPLKLIEYGSYTCPHCAAFAAESKAVLRDRMIRSGKVSLEYRHLVRDPADLAAAVLARCAGPKGFVGASEAIFASQPQWIERVVTWQNQHPEIATMPEDQRLRAYAAASGLDATMRGRGLTQRQIDACFADKAGVARIVAMTSDAPADVQYTPFFFLNGQPQPNMSWATLEPILRAKGAR